MPVAEALGERPDEPVRERVELFPRLELERAVEPDPRLLLLIVVEDLDPLDAPV